jgi:PPP family 3-phenylpropionic acid transporter
VRSIKYQYFFGYAVIGSVAPYASVYLAWRELDDAQIGLVMSLGGLAALLMPVIMSLLADLKLENRVLLRSVFIGAAASLGLMLASRGFWWLMPTFLLWALAIAPMMSLNDGLLFSVRSLREAEGRTTPPYHRIRVFGTMGFIAPSLALYLWMAREGASVSSSLVCGIVTALIAAATTFFLPHTRGPIGEPRPATEVPDPHPPAKDGKPLPTLLALRQMLSPDLALFCAAMCLIQIATTTYYTFYPLYLTREIGLADEWLGLVSSVGVVLEIGYVLAFGWLLRKLGVRWLLIFGLAGVVLRMGLLWAVPTLTVAIGTQIIHGLTVIAIFVLPPLYLNHRAEPAFRNSMQGLYAMLIFGSGRIVGSIFAGLVSEAYGGDILKMFAITAGIAATSMLLVLLFFRDRSTTPIDP